MSYPLRRITYHAWRIRNPLGRSQFAGEIGPEEIAPHAETEPLEQAAAPI